MVRPSTPRRRSRALAGRSAACRGAIPSAATALIPCPTARPLMERRVLIAVFLSFLVLYGYQAFFVPPPPPTPASQARQPPRPRRQQPPSRHRAATPAPPPNRRLRLRRPSVVGETAEREIVVDTATVRRRLTNRGGRILHWRLKEYRDDQGEPVDLVPSALPAGSADAVLAARGRRRDHRAPEQRAVSGTATRRPRRRATRRRRRSSSSSKMPRAARAEGIPLRPGELRRHASRRRSRATASR